MTVGLECLWYKKIILTDKRYVCKCMILNIIYMQSHSHAKCITFTRHSLITNLNAIIGMKREITTTVLCWSKSKTLQHSLVNVHKNLKSRGFQAYLYTGKILTDITKNLKFIYFISSMIDRYITDHKFTLPLALDHAKHSNSHYKSMPIYTSHDWDSNNSPQKRN